MNLLSTTPCAPANTPTPFVPMSYIRHGRYQTHQDMMFCMTTVSLLFLLSCARCHADTSPEQHIFYSRNFLFGQFLICIHNTKKSTLTICLVVSLSVSIFFVHFELMFCMLYSFELFILESIFCFQMFFETHDCMYLFSFWTIIFEPHDCRWLVYPPMPLGCLFLLFNLISCHKHQLFGCWCCDVRLRRPVSVVASRLSTVIASCLSTHRLSLPCVDRSWWALDSVWVIG